MRRMSRAKPKRLGAFPGGSAAPDKTRVTVTRWGRTGTAESFIGELRGRNRQGVAVGVCHKRAAENHRLASGRSRWTPPGAAVVIWQSLEIRHEREPVPAIEYLGTTIGPPSSNPYWLRRKGSSYPSIGANGTHRAQRCEGIQRRRREIHCCRIWSSR